LRTLARDNKNPPKEESGGGLGRSVGASRVALPLKQRVPGDSLVEVPLLGLLAPVESLDRSGRGCIMRRFARPRPGSLFRNLQPIGVGASVCEAWRLVGCAAGGEPAGAPGRVPTVLSTECLHGNSERFRVFDRKVARRGARLRFREWKD
jgi:hypothetical protein